MMLRRSLSASASFMKMADAMAGCRGRDESTEDYRFDHTTDRSCRVSRSCAGSCLWGGARPASSVDAGLSPPARLDIVGLYTRGIGGGCCCPGEVMFEVYIFT